MEIVWLGHSSLRLQSGGVTLVTDPFDGSMGISMSNTKADIVTISHDHPHHSHVAAVSGNPRVINGPGEYEIGSFYIRGVGTRRNSAEEARKLNTLYTIRVEGLTITHLGDLNQALSARQTEDLSKTDVLIVPAGGVCTIGVDRIAALVNVINARIVIPIHYKTDETNVELNGIDPFIREIGAENVSPVARVNVTATSLPRDTQTVILRRAS
jgi:L-ascorbate metabolism protein UlaG (beta-lactamase superfamily)